MSEEKSLRLRVLDWLEKDRFSLTSAVIYIFLVAAFRSYLDSLVKDHGWYNIYEMAHYVFVAYPEFLLGSLVIFLLTTAPIRKVWNVILLGFWALLIPPIVDFFILGQYGPEVGAQYGYLAMDELLPLLTSLMLNPFERPADVGSTGQMVMFITMIIGSIAYVALRNDLAGRFMDLLSKGKKKTSEFFSSLIKTVLTYYGLFFTFWIIGALQFITRIGRESVVVFNIFSFQVETKYYEFFSTHGYAGHEILPPATAPQMGLLETLAYNQFNLLFGLVFVLVSIPLILVSLYMTYKKTLILMLKNIRALDTSLIISAALVGIASLHLIDPDFSQGWAVNPFYILHFQYVVFCLIAVFLLAQFSFLTDDIYSFKRGEERDTPLSNGLISKYHYKHLASAYAVSALFISFVLGRWTLLIAIVWIIISLIFSSSLAKISYGALMKGGVFGSLAFLMGYYTPGSWIAFILEHADGRWIHASNETLIRTPAFSFETFILLLFVSIGIALLSLYSRENTFFHSKIRERFDKSKFTYFIVPIIFLVPLVSYSSVLAIIITLSLAVGTILWHKILERDVVVKIGFLILVVSFSFLLL